MLLNYHCNVRYKHINFKFNILQFIIIMKSARIEKNSIMEKRGLKRTLRQEKSDERDMEVDIKLQTIIQDI